MSISSEAYRNTAAARIGRWVLAVAIPGSALAIGSVHPLSMVVVSAAVCVALVLVWRFPLKSLPRNAVWAVAGGLLLIGVTALQLVPLPSTVVHVVAPANADVWARALVAFGEAPPSIHPLSVAPSVTTVQLLRGLTYLAVFLATLRLVAADLSSFVERAIVVSATLMAILALAHPAVGAERVLGLYRPRDLYSYPVHNYAPLLNTNHLSAYLNTGVCVALASLIGSKPVLPRPLLGAVVLLLAGTSIWAASRGGMAGLALGVVTIFVTTWWSRSQYVDGKGQFVIAAFVGVAAAVLIGLASSDAARSELGNADLGKLDLAAAALKLVPDVPWIGFGRGAFEDVFPRVRVEPPRYVTFTNPENILAQWATEWGVPASVIGGAFFFWALRPSALFSGVRPAIGAWVAIVVSAAHDLVDFHLEVPGVMIPVAACAALTIGRRQSAADRSPLRRKVFGVSFLTVAILTVVALAGGATLADERIVLSRHSTDPQISADRFRDELRTAILRHPSEPFFPLMGAVRAETFGEGNVVVWVSAALERYPRFGRAHFVLARSLGRRNPSQARLEYRLAFENDVTLRDQAVREGARLVGNVGEAMELVVTGQEGIPALELLSATLAGRLPSTVDVLQREMLRRDPSNRAALIHSAEDAISDVVNRHPWCEQERCGDAVLATTEALVRAHPGDCMSRLLRVRGVVAASTEPEAHQRAFDELVASIDGVTDRASCQRSMLQAMNDLGDERHVDAMLDGLDAAGCGSATDCLELSLWAAHFEEKRGRDVSALAFYKRAHEQDPDREDVLEAILRLAVKRNMLGDAQMAAEALARRHPEDDRRASTAKELADRLRKDGALRRPAQKGARE